MSKTIIILFVLFSFSRIMADDSFDQFQDSINILLESAQYNQALDYLDDNQKIYNAFDFELSDLRAQIYLNTDEIQKAYEIWSDGHDKGYFYLLHPAIPLYKEIKEDSAFLALSQKDLALRQSANDSARTIYEVALPESYSSSKSYPLLLVLHGGGRTIEQAKTKWQSDSLKNSFITVYLQSYRHYNYNKYGWASGDQRSWDELAVIYKELLEKYPVDTNKIIIGGISAGGSMALDLAFNNIIPVNGLIGICPGKPRGFADSLVVSAKNRDLKIYFIGGETDFYLEYQKEMTKIFDQYSLLYEHHIVDGLGHDYPENFPQWLKQGCDFLIQN